MQHRDDEYDWLAAYRDGDAGAFRRFVELYGPRVVQFFQRLCQDRDRAEDLAQDLFLKLVAGAGRYRSQGRLSVFVFRVASNLWIDAWRQAQPRPRFWSYEQCTAPADGAPREFAGSEPGPTQQLADRDDLAALRAALAGLPPAQRLLLELAVYQQRPYAVIGSMLGIPVGTVKSRMHHAVGTLRQCMGVGPGPDRRPRAVKVPATA